MLVQYIFSMEVYSILYYRHSYCVGSSMSSAYVSILMSCPTGVTLSSHCMLRVALVSSGEKGSQLTVGTGLLPSFGWERSIWWIWRAASE